MAETGGLIGIKAPRVEGVRENGGEKSAKGISMNARITESKQGSGTSTPPERNWTCPDRAEISQVIPVANARFAHAGHPYSVPHRMAESLVGLRDYWNKLKRGNADIPFADDVSLQALGNLPGIFLLRAYEMPERFRFDVAGRAIVRVYGRDIAGNFVDEIPARSPLDYFLSQCSATVNARAPTFYRHMSAEKNEGASYQRLLLPLWADGHIGELLGAVSAI